MSIRDASRSGGKGRAVARLLAAFWLVLLLSGALLAQTSADFDSAVIFMKSERWTEAKPLLESILAKNPSHPEARNNLAVCLIKLKQFKAAEDILVKLVKDRPEKAGSQLNLGVARQGLTATDQALQDTERALEQFRDMKPSSVYRIAIVRYNRAWLLDEKGQYDEAILSYLEALQLRPDYGKAWIGLAIAYGKLQRYKDARAALDKAWVYRQLEGDLTTLIETNRKGLDDLESGREPAPPVVPPVTPPVKPTTPQPPAEEKVETPPVPPGPSGPSILGDGVFGVVGWWDDSPAMALTGYGVLHVLLWAGCFVGCRMYFRPPLNRDQLYTTAFICAGVGFLAFVVCWGFSGWVKWLGLLVAAAINAGFVLGTEE